MSKLYTNTELLITHNDYCKLETLTRGNFNEFDKSELFHSMANKYNPIQMVY